MTLTPEEARALGCLLEKERTTPDAYPLSLHALVVAGNQATNRAPVVAYDDSTVEQALDGLRDRGLVRRGVYPGSRVVKFRQVAVEEWNLDPEEAALLCLLLLRGAQTAGELKGRSERLHAFAGLEEVDAALARLAEREEPLALRRDREPGQKEARWETVLAAAAPPTGDAGSPFGTPFAPAPGARPGTPSGDASGGMSVGGPGGAALEAAVDALRAEVEGLRDGGGPAGSVAGWPT